MVFLSSRTVELGYLDTKLPRGLSGAMLVRLVVFGGI